MTESLAIGWFVALVCSVLYVAGSMANIDIVDMFPEGQRWWHIPNRLAALACFATVVLANPWGSLW